MATDIVMPSRPSQLQTNIDTSTTTTSRKRHSPSLSLDFSDLPPLSQPTPPSNTLLITNLNDAHIFTAPNLDSIRSAIEAQAPLYSFSPLKYFRRIIAVFYDSEAATSVRQALDGESLFNQRVRVYFGTNNPVSPRDQHLSAPKSQKMFFISPPPSPPADWAMRNEDPPNKEVHAVDLAVALRGIEKRAIDADQAGQGMLDEPVTPNSAGVANGRSRASTIVFDPLDHGSDAGLPAIAVVDTSGDEDEDTEMGDGQGDRVVTHTSRPPVELME